MFVKGLSLVGDRVNKKAANTHDVRRLSGAQHGVLQQRRSETFSLPVAIDSQSAKHRNRNRVRHIAPDCSRRIGDRERSRRQAIITDNALAFANHIGSRCATGLIGPRPAAQPFIKTVVPAGEELEIMRFAEKRRR